VSESIQRQRFLSTVPPGFIPSLLSAVIKANKLVGQSCMAEYERTEAHDLLPDLRRAKVEGVLRNVAMEQGGKAAATSNNNGGAYHSEVRFGGAGGTVILTQSCVEDETKLPRPATFRKSLARAVTVDPQLDLFDRKPAAPLPGQYVYAIFTHGKPAGANGVPSFARIVFPDVRGRTIIDSVDLTVALHAAAMAKPVVVAEPTPKVGLKKKQRRDKDQA